MLNSKFKTTDMKLLNKFTLPALAMVMLASSCWKEDINEGLPNNEKTIVKLPQGEDELYSFALDAAPGDIVLDVLDVRRDVKSEKDLSATNIIKIAPAPELIDDFNAANGTSYELFTDYELDASSPFDGSTWNLTFGPGDFAKAIKIKFDPSQLDFSKQYAMAFKIQDAGGLAVSATKNQALVEIAVKNKYDGVYVMTGTMVDLANAAITGQYPQEVALATVASNAVVMVPTDLGIPGHLILSGGSLSYYGSYGPTFIFDPATDKVTAVVNAYGQPAGNTRSAELNPAGLNQWNAADKSMDVMYYMKQPSVVPAAPNIRVTFDEHFEYKGPR
jgi:hypothetical protein